MEQTSRLAFGDRASLPNQLVCGDNLQVMANLPSGSVDLIYMDPPFGTGQARTGSGGAHYRDPGGDPAGFVTWLMPRLTESHRLLAEHGSIFVHLDYRAVHYIKVALDGVFGYGRLINEIVWCYSVGGKSRRSFGRKHDTILWYGRGDRYHFDGDAVRVARKQKSHMRKVRGPDGQWVQEKTDRKTGRVYRYPVAAGKIPEDWWTDIETLNHSDGERCGWPTQKPERLLERIVRAASRPGQLVADWFAGSGTTAVVAQGSGRRFLAVDRSATAIALAATRLETQGRDLARSGRPPPDLEIHRAQSSSAKSADSKNSAHAAPPSGPRRKGQLGQTSAG